MVCLCVFQLGYTDHIGQLSYRGAGVRGLCADANGIQQHGGPHAFRYDESAHQSTGKKVYITFTQLK